MASIAWLPGDQYPRKKLPAGTTLFHEGDFGDCMYMVVTGRLDILKRVVEGTDKIIAALGVGQYVGEMSLLTGAQRSATVRAVEDTEVLEIDQQAFTQLLHDQPQVGLELMQQMAHRLRETTEELVLASLEAALAQRAPQRLQGNARRMRFVLTGSFPSDKAVEVLRLAAARLPFANRAALQISMVRLGRTQEALLYVLETDDPRELLELTVPFLGLVQWDIAPALDIDEMRATIPFLQEGDAP